MSVSMHVPWCVSIGQGITAFGSWFFIETEFLLLILLYFRLNDCAGQSYGNLTQAELI